MCRLPGRAKLKRALDPIGWFYRHVSSNIATIRTSQHHHCFRGTIWAMWIGGVWIDLRRALGVLGKRRLAHMDWPLNSTNFSLFAILVQILLMIFLMNLPFAYVR
jgi:hypothetical protein